MNSAERKNASSYLLKVEMGMNNPFVQQAWSVEKGRKPSPHQKVNANSDFGTSIYVI